MRETRPGKFIEREASSSGGSTSRIKKLQFFKSSGNREDMARRTKKTLLGPVTIPPPNESSEEEEYEPLYARNIKRSTYEGLEVSSSSDNEYVAALSSPEECQPEVKEKKKKKKKKKNRPYLKNADDLDEIDRSVLEVNALLGEPSPPVVVPVPAPDRRKLVFATKYQHLDVTYELNRIFGRDSDEERPKKRRGRQQHFKRIQRNGLIRKEYNFKNAGLSMSVNRREGDLTFFTFDHNRDYQRRHKDFLKRLIRMRHVFDYEESLKYMHIEGLIEAVDTMFRHEDNSGANTLIEHIIAYMQYVADVTFSITDIRNRLEYKFIENRPFHIILLKYLHLLSNRACHRTALEIAKLLLNLDPSDPLAVVFIIDTVAIRAREHQWLIECIEFLDKERDAGFLFNIMYSKALAYFHVASKKRESLERSDELLKTAMIAFPWTVRELLEESKQFSDEQVRNHDLFDKHGGGSTSKCLKTLTQLYVAFAGSWWNEQPVRQWLIRNAKELANQYDRDQAVKDEVTRMEHVRSSLFRGMPTEVLRHLTVIKHMADLLIERKMPYVEHTYGFDPHPTKNTVNRYGYSTSPNIAYLQLTLDTALITNFFASLNPNYEVPSPEELHELFFAGPTLNQLIDAINMVADDAEADGDIEYEDDIELDDSEDEYGDAEDSENDDSCDDDSEDDNKDTEENEVDDDEDEEDDSDDNDDDDSNDEDNEDGDDEDGDDEDEGEDEIDQEGDDEDENSDDDAEENGDDLKLQKLFIPLVDHSEERWTD